MTIRKVQFEEFAQFFAAPTRDGLRDLLKRNIGETDYLDFKVAWPGTAKLAKHILALANSGGGAMVIGVAEQPDGALEPVGAQLKDKSELVQPLAAYLPSSLDYDIYVFSYGASDFHALVGKSFQVLLVEDRPKQLPFLALREAEGLRTTCIYVREATTSTEAGHAQLQTVLNRRIESGHSTQPGLDLERQIQQLRVLDEQRSWNDSWVSEFDRRAGVGDTESSDFREFLEHAYEAKKRVVLQLIGLTPDALEFFRP